MLEVNYFLVLKKPEKIMLGLCNINENLNKRK